jgi:glyoxylase-like metal-dependent hydrolase (beta-lactamase superfamily II)
MNASASSVPSLDFGPVTVFFGEKNGKYPDGNQVIVRGTDTRVVFDSPPVANRIGPAFDEADLCILGHVHEDHVCGLHRIARAAVHVHEADVQAARSWEGLARHYGYPQQVLDDMKVKVQRDFNWTARPEAQAYSDGATWDVGGARIRAFHMPGHTSGHSVLLVEPHGVAFIGDIDLSGFGPYYGDATSSLAQFRDTLRRVVDVPAKVWITSHHRGAVTDRAHFLAALSAFSAKLDERTAKLLQMLGSEPRTLAELVAQRLIYPPGHAELWVDDVEARTIGQHLDELIAQGRVERVAPDRFRACC